MPDAKETIPQPIRFPDKPLQAQRLPRYTSYPPATEFDALAGSTHQQWLTELPRNKPVSLYVHIPFCQQLCWFCGCFTSITQHYDPIKRYVKLLLQEIEWVQKQVGTLSISHLHFGGGSPTALSAADFGCIIRAFQHGFTFLDDAEIAVEIDPRTADNDKIAAYADHGVNRASLGAQDFDSKVQEAIHREQPYELVADITQQLRDHGIKQINLDLMYGLPYQTVDSVANNAKLALTLKPARLAVFGYAHVPWMRKHQAVLNDLPMANPDTRIKMFAAMRQVFIDNDYVAIGIDHFAHPNDDMSKALQEKRLTRNFQGYTTDQASTILGFGISAISSLPQGYAQNTSKVKAYKAALKDQVSNVSRGLAITQEDALRRELICELMCHYEVDLEALKQRYQLDIDFNAELTKLQPFTESGYVESNNNSIRVLESGKPYVRAVCAVFDCYLEESDNRFSLAV